MSDADGGCGFGGDCQRDKLEEELTDLQAELDKAHRQGVSGVSDDIKKQLREAAMNGARLMLMDRQLVPGAPFMDQEAQEALCKSVVDSLEKTGALEPKT